MRRIENINKNWIFCKGKSFPEGCKDGAAVDLPFTWNGNDGQDGGNDYFRGISTFTRIFPSPALNADERLYLEFKGVNSSAEVYLNGSFVTRHDGGYSTFRADITALLREENTLSVLVDNTATEKVYPQTADFTFYGGIYRDVNLITVNQNHFVLDYLGASGIRVKTDVEGNEGVLNPTAYVTGAGEVTFTVTDKEGKKIAEGGNGQSLRIPDVRLWQGIADPYLYTVTAVLTVGGTAVDKATCRVGFRTFSVDPKKGFILNGKPYPLRGVSRHQDRPGIGNALTKAEHDEDMALIREIGANTIRLAHYQHDDYFYDLCDEYGMVVWAEIPYISRHMPEANDNALLQMKELICQQYNHPCIVTWGLSNEITMFRKHRKDMLQFHRKLNDFVHATDPSRFTSLACFAMCAPWNKVGKISDAVGWNLYLGWYVPGFFLNKLWLGLYKMLNHGRCLAFTEYGAEGMPNLHAERPRRGDNTEEYQAKYHEYMLKFFEKHPELWGTYVWNMFDFAADARNQGGEPGMNHKGLVTFDRKTKKDSFYLYQAYWSERPFVHICGKRFKNRTGKYTDIRVYSNQKQITLFVNGNRFETLTGERVFVFKVPLNGVVEVKAVCGEVSDEATFHRVSSPDPSYKLRVKSQNQSWEK